MAWSRPASRDARQRQLGQRSRQRCMSCRAASQQPASSTHRSRGRKPPRQCPGCRTARSAASAAQLGAFGEGPCRAPGTPPSSASPCGPSSDVWRPPPCTPTWTSGSALTSASASSQSSGVAIGCTPSTSTQLDTLADPPPSATTASTAGRKGSSGSVERLCQSSALDRLATLEKAVPAGPLLGPRPCTARARAPTAAHRSRGSAARRTPRAAAQRPAGCPPSATPAAPSWRARAG